MILSVEVENLKKDDIIIYDGKKWINIKNCIFLGDLYNQLKIIQEELKNAKIGLKQAENTIMELASIIKGE